MTDGLVLYFHLSVAKKSLILFMRGPFVACHPDNKTEWETSSCGLGSAHWTGMEPIHRPHIWYCNYTGGTFLGSAIFRTTRGQSLHRTQINSDNLEFFNLYSNENPPNTLISQCVCHLKGFNWRYMQQICVISQIGTQILLRHSRVDSDFTHTIWAKICQVGTSTMQCKLCDTYVRP